jgi:hypothetical protein
LARRPPPTWTWTAHRLAISAFVAAHVAAVVLWNLPDCPLKAKVADGLGFYMYPLGLWQSWGMFAPDPVKETVAMEAVVLDRHGLIHRLPFPRAADVSPWQGPWVFRHSKYAANMVVPESAAQREFAARYVTRRLGLGAEHFPADVQLLYQLRPSPKPGEPADPAAEPRPAVIDTFRFPTLEETRP